MTQASTRWMLVASCLALMCLCERARAQTQSSAPCDAADEKQAKMHYERAEAHQAEERYSDAATDYLAAFDLCARPFLVFNAGQMYWFDGDTARALTTYERYLQLAPDGRASTTARERIFEAGERFLRHDEPAAALAAFEQYIRLDPDGAHITAAQRHARDLRQVLASDVPNKGASAREPTEDHASERAILERTTPADSAVEHTQNHLRDSARTTRAGAHWKPWSVVGTGALLLTVGALVHARAIDDGDRYDDMLQVSCPGGCAAADVPDDVRRTLTDARTQQRVAIAAYVSGGVAVAAGITWLVWQRRSAHARGQSDSGDQRARAIDVRPLISASAVGGSVTMTFD